MRSARLICVLVAVIGSAPQSRAQAPDSESWTTDFDRASVPLSEIIPGGPPKDGIPSIDAPRFETLPDADLWLEATDPILVVESGGGVKAYPLAILVWHEIVNDEVGGLPIVVTFCPLCNTALVFERRIDDRVLDFGTTGRLRLSDLVMYDRQTESWWQQALGEAIVGELTGTRLSPVIANTLAWAKVRDLFPEILVLSRDTGHPDYRDSGRYGRNPYVRYDSRDRPYSLFRGKTSYDLPALERVAAVESGRGWAAAFSDLAREGVAQGEAGGLQFVVFWSPGASSALDASRIAAGRDVGQSAAFDRWLDGRSLTFESVVGEDGLYRDRETGSKWNLAGRAVSGPFEGRNLEPVLHSNPFWFAWAAFRPDTEIWSP